MTTSGAMRADGKLRQIFGRNSNALCPSRDTEIKTLIATEDDLHTVVEDHRFRRLSQSGKYAFDEWAVDNRTRFR